MLEKIKQMKTKAMIGLGLAGASIASASPAWAPADTASTSFNEVLSYAAPIAIGVVVGVAGIRVVIKLINRGAGK